MNQVTDRIDEISRGYVLEPFGVRFTRDPTQTEWIELGRVISRRVEGAAWALGDWMLCGGRRYKFGGPHLNPYRKAAEITGYSEHYLRECAQVSEEYPLDQRIAGVSNGTHRLALRLPKDQRAPMLRRFGTVDLLRGEIEALERKAHVAQHKELAPPFKSSNVQTGAFGDRARRGQRVRCPKCSHTFAIIGHRVV